VQSVWPSCHGCKLIFPLTLHIKKTKLNWELYLTDVLKTKIKLSKTTMGPHVGTSSVKWSTWRFITLHSNYVTSPSAVLFYLYCFQMAAVATRTTSDEWSRDIQLIIKIKMSNEWTDQDCCYVTNIFRTTEGLENNEMT